MKISELKIGQSSVDIEASVKSIEEPRSFNRFGREIKVTNALIEDESGSIKLTLWNQDIDTVKVGDKVKITNGYVNEFNGEKQLTSGKFGKLEVIKGEGQEKAVEAEQAAEPTIEEPEELGEEKEEKIEEEKVEPTEEKEENEE